MSISDEMVAKRIHINGIVQGVGFRPFVHQMARRFGIKGQIANTGSGVIIHAEGRQTDIESFYHQLMDSPPPLARITDSSVESDSVRGLAQFDIVESQASENRSTLISPDVAICADCLRELTDPLDRRYHYPFINCTNCGPRYTIISDIPYDRPNTSMKHFQMCRLCQAEYDDPANRRFHAQPNACPECGPQVALYDAHRNAVLSLNPIETTAALLQQGYILAIKGLGGFHLAADACNPDAVIRLRTRKTREEKPFAVMAGGLETIRQIAVVEPEEEALLTSYQRPIVLLKKKFPHPVTEAVSPKNQYFGVMLPYTPLHYLIFENLPHSILIMTSGNQRNEPIAIDNDEAFERLSQIADYFLIHNRDIYWRSDDSIVRSSGLIRRSRGYVPVPVFLKHRMPPILACGAELKNTICLTKEDKAFISQHIGDLENWAAYEFFQLTVDHMRRILDIQPERIAHDLHPDYLSTRYALEQDIPTIGVQHHHAHIVSCMAENQIEGPVIGLACDGTGYGTDGAVWGGEVLIADEVNFSRAAHLGYIPMPGSAAAIKEPWRMAVSYLVHTFGHAFIESDLPMFQEIDESNIRITLEMIRKRINSPLTSSLGRLFDGVAALIGIRNRVSFEGQAAMELEMMADTTVTDGYDVEWKSDNGYQIQIQPIIRGVIEDMRACVPASVISGKFHRTLIHLFTQLCKTIRNDTGLNRAALSGGVFQNALLLNGLRNALNTEGFDVYTHHLVPANDGGISLGQAVVAGAIR